MSINKDDADEVSVNCDCHFESLLVTEESYHVENVMHVHKQQPVSITVENEREQADNASSSSMEVDVASTDPQIEPFEPIANQVVKALEFVTINEDIL